MAKDRVIITCEHAGNVVPKAYAPLFVEHGHLLPTHRGWDPGALILAREMASRFDAPLFFETTTRLLVDLNRSVGVPDLHSEATRHLPLAERRKILERYYHPHRTRVDAAIVAAAKAARVVHIASHSFTPVLHGVVRTADIGILYDPKRAGEAALATLWIDSLRQADPGLRLRRNYPYLGASDGIMQPLRRKLAPDRYVGIELEVNQRYAEAGGPEFGRVRRLLVASLDAALRAFARGSPGSSKRAPSPRTARLSPGL